MQVSVKRTLHRIALLAAAPSVIAAALFAIIPAGSASRAVAVTASAAPAESAAAQSVPHRVIVAPDGATTTTVAPPPKPTAAPTPPPAPSTTVPAPRPAPATVTAAAVRPAQPSQTVTAADEGYGCAAALAYLAANAAPGFHFECPGYSLGHQAMTCINVAGVCPGTELIVITIPCRAAYMNEAHNSWVLAGLRPGTIDPYGYCQT
ncbi:MAG TPA: hypothetical protein VKU88_12810 [Acidimicrobiales bacterium]|nr:hypothetical protein [Acidimicrobiales bacterium]